MVDFPNIQGIQSVSQVSPVARPDAGRAVAGKNVSYPVVEQAASTDVVRISADAVMKGRLSAFASALLNEMNATNPGRMAQLKKDYAGDSCPVSAYDIAGAIVGRIRLEGYGNE